MGARYKLLGTYIKTRTVLNGLISRLDGMPWLLRITCLASLCVGLALLVISVFQIGSFRIYDQTLSWRQLKVAGYYPFLVVIALSLMAAGIGIWLHSGWSRWIVVLLYLITSPIDIIYSRSHTQNTSGLIWDSGVSGVIWAAFFYWYLFYKQRKFFDGSRTSSSLP